MKPRMLQTLGIGMISLALAGSPGVPAGTVNFANNNASKVLNGQTGNPVASTDNVRAALYWAPVGSSDFVQATGAVVQVGVPLPGLFAGGTRTNQPASPGSTARFLVRAWSGGFSSYEEAQTNSGVLLGQSAIIETPTGDPGGFPPTPPASLTAAGLLALTVTDAGKPCALCPSGLIAWWPGDGSATNLTGVNHGILTNHAGFQTGKVGTAFSFDGVDDAVVVPPSPMLDVENAFTIACWVKADDARLSLLLGRFGPDTSGYGLMTSYDGRSYRLQIDQGSTQADLVSTTPITFGVFQHVVGTFDGTRMSLYVDARLEASRECAAAPRSSDAPLMLGRTEAQNGYRFRGGLDEVLVFNRALSSNEIASIYAAGSAGICKVDLQSGLVAYYPFQGNAMDLSGNGLDGTVYEAVPDSDRFGQTNSSFRFASTNHWIRSDIGPTNFAGDFSLAAWVRFRDFDNDYPTIAMGDGYYVVFHGCGPVYDQNGWRRHVTFYQQHLTDQNQRMGFMVSSKPLTNNCWHHVCVTRSGLHYTMYVDGELSTETTSPQHFPLVGSHLGFGLEPPTAAGAHPRDWHALHGNLDEIRIYNRPLSPLEVRALWQWAGDSNAAPDLALTSIQAPTHVLAGRTMTVSCQVTNRGAASVINPFLIRVLLSSDQQLGQDVQLGELPFTAELAPGAFFDRSLDVSVPGPGGQYWLFLVVDATNSVVELDEANNATDSRLWVEQAYSAQVWTDVDLAPVGTPIPLQGRVVYSNSGDPAAHQPVWVHLRVHTMHMVLNGITADETGTFTATYRSSGSKAGFYDIYATPPDVPVGQTQDSFTLLGMRFETNRVSHTLLGLSAVTNLVWLENLGPASIGGLSATVTGGGPELGVEVGVSPILPGSANLPVVYWIESLVNAPWQGEVILRMDSVEGVVAELPIDVTVVPHGPPRLEAELGPNQARTLTLHGTTGFTYQISWTTNLMGDVGDLGQGWVLEPAWQVALTGSQQQFAVPEQYRSPVFFSAYQIDPPTVAVRDAEGLPGDLWLFGVPGQTCQVQSTADLTGQSGWTTLATVTLTNSFHRLERVVPPDQQLLFRAVKQ